MKKINETVDRSRLNFVGLLLAAGTSVVLAGCGVPRMTNAEYEYELDKNRRVAEKKKKERDDYKKYYDKYGAYRSTGGEGEGHGD